MPKRLQFVLLWIATWPYHWTLQHYTISPVRKIVQYSGDVGAASKWIDNFRAKRQHELSFVKIASTISAAATVGALSWPSLASSLWLAPALWYSSLILSIFSLIMSAQHTALLNVIPNISQDGTVSDIYVKQMLDFVARPVKSFPNPTHKTSASASSGSPGQDCEKAISSVKYRPSWKMIYIWQTPMMLMSWSWATFMFALTLHVAAPLAKSVEQGDDRKAAVFFLVVAGIAVLNFAWCSFWTYKLATAVTFSEMDDTGTSQDDDQENNFNTDIRRFQSKIQ